MHGSCVADVYRVHERLHPVVSRQDQYAGSRAHGKCDAFRKFGCKRLRHFLPDSSEIDFAQIAVRQQNDRGAERVASGVAVEYQVIAVDKIRQQCRHAAFRDAECRREFGVRNRLAALRAELEDVERAVG